MSFVYIGYTDCSGCWPCVRPGQVAGAVIHFPPSRAPKRVGHVRERHPERKVWKPP